MDTPVCSRPSPPPSDEELERLEAELRVLENRVALATIQLRWERRASPGPIGWAFYGLYQGIKWLFVWE